MVTFRELIQRAEESKSLHERQREMFDAGIMSVHVNGKQIPREVSIAECDRNIALDAYSIEAWKKLANERGGVDATV